MTGFRPYQSALTREKLALKRVFETVFAPSFASSENPDGIGKPTSTICPSQMRGFNARQMIANQKAQMYTHFHKYQYATIKAQVDQHITEELSDSEKRNVIKKISFFISQRINQLVFVTDLDRYQSYANAHSGVITDQLWNEAISIPIQAVPTTSEAHGTDIETREQEEEEEEENTRLDDNESDESDSDEDEEDDVPTEAEQRVATAGERLARQHIEMTHCRVSSRHIDDRWVSSFLSLLHETGENID